MASLPILFLSAFSRLYLALRHHAYVEMNHIAGSWLPTGLPERDSVTPREVIRIDFALPREHRLILANRRIGSLPY